MAIERVNYFIVAVLTVVLAATSKGSTPESASFNVAGCRCDGRTNPLGIDTLSPRLGWCIQANERALVFDAFQIRVATVERELRDTGALVWDSGKISNNDPTQVIYDGPPLVSGQRYFWQVRVWNANGKVSPWSEPAWWEMALLHASDWTASWIDDGRPVPDRDEDFYKQDPAPLFRKVFDVDKPIERARLYIAGIGYNEAAINGERVGNSMLDPAWTTYSKRVLYSTYDVTELVRSGRNCVGIVLGNGWYNALPLRFWGQLNLRDFMPMGRPRVIAQLIVDHADGSQTAIGTNGTWKTAPGPILRNNIYLGELYDARNEIEGWKLPEFDEAGWTNAVVARGQLGELRVQMQPSIEQTAFFRPIARTQPKPGVYVFDVGQNLAGWVRLNVQGPRGTEVKLRFGELLYPDGTLNVMTTVAGQIKDAGVGGPGAPAVAEQMDTYVLKGAGDGQELETYTPRFTYHGFRYVEVTGYPGEPGLDALEAVRLNTNVESVGSFTCSNELLNRIQMACRATFPSNLIGVQTDCPGRERFAYGDDIACACEAHLFNYDMSAFYAKTVRDFADAARPNGALTLLAPWTGHSIGGFDPGGGSFADVGRNGANAGSGPLSGVLAHSLLLKKAYQHYGDRPLIEEQYETARRSLEFIRGHAPDHIITVGLGDWSSIEPTNTSILDTALYYHHGRIIAQLARVLGRNEDAREYAGLADEIKAAFIREFIEADASKVGFDTQAARACALYHGLLPEPRRDAIAQALVDDVVEKHDGHLSTGIFGTKYLLDVLTTADRSDVASTIVNQTTFPGWGYMLERGATTLWEVWEFSDNVYSHNHSMFGTVSAWFFTALGGIRPAEDAIGFDKIVLEPRIVPGLTWVKCSHNSIRGPIISNWRVEGDFLHWDVQIPPTSVATVHFPKEFARDVREGSVAAEESIGVTSIAGMDDSSVYRVESGSYSFTGRRTATAHTELR